MTRPNSRERTHRDLETESVGSNCHSTGKDMCEENLSVDAAFDAL